MAPYHHYYGAISKWLKPVPADPGVVGGFPATALAWSVDGLQWGTGNYLTWG